MSSIATMADRKILEHYAPAGVVINESLDIVYFRGRTSPYLEQPSGIATHNILRLVRPDLQATLKRAIESALSSNEGLVMDMPTLGENGAPLTLILRPLQDPETSARCLLILFKEADGTPGTRSESKPSETPAEPEGALEHELAVTKDYLQSTIQQLERANEELTSANEELQSSNEELQSTNEELETSKEEIQSTNEELITLNEELQSRMRDLGAANDDLHNLLGGISSPVVIVGADLRIRRFSRAAEKLLSLAPEDVGRTASHLNSFMGALGIEKMIRSTIEEGTSSSRELQAVDRRWYRVRVAPYRSADQSVRGALIAIDSADPRGSRSEIARAVDEYAAEFLSALLQPLLIIDRQLKVVWVNDAYCERFAASRTETVGLSLLGLWQGQWSEPALHRLLSSTLSSGEPFRGNEITYVSDGGSSTVLRVSGSRVRGVANEEPLVLITIEGEHPEPAKSDANDE
jgi:two-component system CheB/CheR fusion protein